MNRNDTVRSVIDTKTDSPSSSTRRPRIAATAIASYSSDAGTKGSACAITAFKPIERPSEFFVHLPLECTDFFDTGPEIGFDLVEGLAEMVVDFAIATDDVLELGYGAIQCPQPVLHCGMGVLDYLVRVTKNRFRALRGAFHGLGRGLDVSN